MGNQLEPNAPNAIAALRKRRVKILKSTTKPFLTLGSGMKMGNQSGPHAPNAIAALWKRRVLILNSTTNLVLTLGSGIKMGYQLGHHAHNAIAASTSKIIKPLASTMESIWLNPLLLCRRVLLQLQPESCIKMVKATSLTMLTKRRKQENSKNENLQSDILITRLKMKNQR